MVTGVAEFLARSERIRTTLDTTGRRLAEFRRLRQQAVAARQALSATVRELRQARTEAADVLYWLAQDGSAAVASERKPAPSVRDASPGSAGYSVRGDPEGAFLATLHGRDLGETTDILIGAYRAAVAQDDEAAAAVLRDMLMQLGRHFAKHLGPKAAGMLLN